VLSCFSTREFVDVMMLKLGSYADRLTQTVLQVLLLALKSNTSRVTVSYDQFKNSLQPHGVVLS